jgi:FixJ family two-component response regulator
VHVGQKRVSPEVAAEIAEHAMDNALTPREIDVLRVIARANANKIIAAELSVGAGGKSLHRSSRAQCAEEAKSATVVKTATAKCKRVGRKLGANCDLNP